MSAEVPWIGAFIALRSARERTVAFLEFMSGRYLRLPKSVLTYPSSFAESIVFLMYVEMDVKFAN